ncbi:extracellular matrix organizing protein FRAS1-like [Argopecten irradians]|uniref:extracellular matrix organizing protein FRAS1-like n=1 Tax=Argopecten irradians TaxID=31199 RepID=UPI0037115BEE
MWRICICADSKEFRRLNLLLVFMILIWSSLMHELEGECLFEGKLYMNHTLWLPDDCTICTCQDPITVCEQVRCTTPKCKFSKGEYLQIPSDDCCPECVQQLLPCQHQGQTVQHNKNWKPDPCTDCLCLDGDVSCKSVACRRLRCKPGEVTQTLPGECCPACIPSGRSCSYDGERYQDGSEWEPIPCAKCVCRDGQTTCYPIQCPPLVCPQDQQMERAPGSCCPRCIGATCTDQRVRYKDGQQWKRDPCTYCVCINGATVCRAKECMPELKCAKTEMNITREGDCCTECLPRESACVSEQPIRYHGDIWNVSSCEFCMCQNGQVQCHTAVCEHLRCTQDQVLVQPDGKCCPECIEPPDCDFAGDTYKDGETWHPDPCSVCNCKDGETVCYQNSCPVCPEGSVSVLQPGECCGQCQPMPCADPCLSCSHDDPQQCTKCRVTSMLVQDGRCVPGCEEGRFATRNNQCQACHETCLTCVDGTRHHCVKCKPGLLWRNGQCVPRCDRNYFQEGGQCIACHRSCSFCVGPGIQDCQSCSNQGQVLQEGQCVDACQSNYYLRNKECLECPPTCRTCSGDGGSCTSCFTGFVLHRTQCLSECPNGFYPSPEGFCLRCHVSCHTCTGPEDTKCTSCIERVRLSKRGRCRMPCADGQYLKRDGSCHSCEFGCSKCFTGPRGRESVCTLCTDPTMVAFDSLCMRRCPIGHYVENQICKECGGGCVQCDSPMQCYKCGPALLLSGDRCVRQCRQHQYRDWENQLCIDCPPDCVECGSGSKCTLCNSRTFLRQGKCVTTCGPGYYENRRTQICEENREAPILQIFGQILTEEGGIASIPADIFYLSDPDTPVEDLHLVLSRTPDNGELVKAVMGRDIALQTEDTFTLVDLHTGKVRFIHNSKAGSKSRITLRASDHMMLSDEATLSIQAVSRQAPRLLRKEPLVVTSGETSTLDNIDFLISGTEDDVAITVLEGPFHGQIIHQKFDAPVTSFTLQDLRAGSIGYRHTGQNSEDRDLFLLQVSDGYHLLNFIININIRIKDNVIPVLVNNKLGRLTSGDMLQLTPDLLLAEVMDFDKTPTRDIIYTLMPTVNNPKQGEVLMVVPIPEDGPGQGWEDIGGGSMAAKMFRFMQRDIDEGRIWYKHKASSATSDVITFEIADTANPPNILRDQRFQLSIVSQAPTTTTPTLAPGVRLGMTVLENQVVPISSSNLAFEDMDTPDTAIVYTVTRPLRDGEGTLEHIDTPFRPTSRFTQADINNNRIVYRPPLSDVGTKEREFSFYFTVSDDGPPNRNPEEQKFSIRVLPVNNVPPRFLNPSPSVTVSQGTAVPLSQSLLAITDTDTPTSDLLVTLTQAPVVGRIEKNHIGGKVVIREGETFHYDELLDSVFQYQHGGSGRQLTDMFVLEVSDGAHQATLRVNVTIVRVDKSSPTILDTASCRININERDTVVIERGTLAFVDQDDEDNRLRITVSSNPVHGRLLYRGARLLQRGGVFTQADINNHHISYQSDREIGSQPITEVLVFNVSDTSGNMLNNQILSVIIQPVDNQEPLVKFGPEIQIEEGGESAITLENIKVTDGDSAVSSLSITIETPPAFGEIHSTRPENLGSEEVEAHTVTSLPLQDILDGHIIYIQTDHTQKEPIQDSFLFIVTDGTNQSPLQRINISIQLINDEAPMVMTEQIFVRENFNVLVTNASLYVVDLDTPADDLIFTVDTIPQHGTLGKRTSVMEPVMSARLLRKGDMFTYKDVLDELLVYRHGGGELPSDSFTLSLTDGKFTDTRTLSVIVGMVNDETPRISINRGLRVNSGSITPIKSKDLQATDIDSNDARIKYTIKRDPTSGRLRLNRSGNPEPQTVSVHGPIRHFYQADIDNGLLEYQNMAGETTGVITFKFDVSDPEGNPLIDQIFYITVLEDRIPPQMLANRELVVSEGAEVKITTDNLSFTDVDSEPGSLQYFLLSAPLLGHLELTDNPGVPISEFTQSDLAANCVLYVHDSPKEVYSDRFTFTVTDGTNEVTHKFNIAINPVDDEIPIVTNNGMRVQEGIRKVITEFDLKAVDKDTGEDHIVFQVIQLPLHGSLDLQEGEEYRPTLTFTMLDIYNSRVSYQHDGSETREDNFSFTVTDGATSMFAMQRDHHRGDIFIPQSAPGEFQIEILPMDDGSPVLEVNRGLQFLELSDGNAYNLITFRELQAVDVDTAPPDLVFLVTHTPRHGRLEKTSNPTVPIFSFTQEDINNGQVQYVLTGDVTQMEDSFTFDLMDKKPNHIPDNEFHIMWSVISFDRPLLNVTESAGVIRIPVTRSGNLKQYAIVTCRTRPDGATSEKVRARPGTHDFIQHSGQVQFDEWQETKVCSIIINDDSIYEGPERLYVDLVDPVYSLVNPRYSQAQVTIYDTEDEPVIQFQQPIFSVNESDGYLSAVLTRTGDLGTSVSVICYTISLTARGSELTHLQSGSDYITRGNTNLNRVVFPPGISTASCEVKLVDDSEFEPAEQFELSISEPSANCRLGPVTKATVIINGPNDVSIVRLALPRFHFDEDAGNVEIDVLRTGADLDHDTIVWCATRLSDIPSATPGQDYIPSSSQITFGPGQSSERCLLTIMDDEGDPRLEGNETFTVFLSSPTGSVLVEPHTATVVIHDDHLDMPTMQFLKDNQTVSESSGQVSVAVVRTGDLSYESSVICYTRQNTALVSQDYVERPLNEESRLYFLPGEQMQSCVVGIVDDADYEPTENFRLHLAEALGTESCEARVGDMVRTVVTVTNQEDVPTLGFEQPAYSVHEPGVQENTETLVIRVSRTGDLSGTSSVRCSTRDGSALSGVDYSPRSQIITFQPNVAAVDFPVDILYNSAIEWHESFTVVLGPEDPTGAEFGQVSVTTVTILDDEVSGSLVLPAAPVVVSLLHYDDVETGSKKDPSPGYPLICVSACDVHHPTYTITHTLCEESNINQSSILYTWEVAMPANDQLGSKPPFVMVTDSTLFTSVNKIVLDSIYFRPTFRVRCITQPRHANGNPGISSKSEAVTISHEEGICKAPVFHGAPHTSYGAQSFLANLDYVGPEDEDHPNTIHISIQIPHQDGHLPLISTFPLHNLRYLLAEPVYRQQHLCSNLITPEERHGIIDSGFLDNPQTFPPVYNFPYQFDSQLRENRTIGLYKHLNLKSCVWSFSAWYHMTDLVDICGGKVISDFQVKGVGQTYLTVSVPLYVYYVYVTAPVGWGSLQHHTDMSFSFYYDNILWQAGLEGEGTVGGDLQVLKVLVGRDGKLVIDLKTHAKFRGMYVLKHHTLPGIESRILPPEGMAITFDLTLMWGQQTFDSPHQLWRATSKFNLKDYTGTYVIELIPCTVSSTQIFTGGQDPIPCTGHQPQRFEVPIAFQQSNRPVPLVYTLNTRFQLTNNRQTFLLGPDRTKDELDFDDTSFTIGEELFGRVMWDPDQDLRGAYRLSVQKVYLCTGSDGFVPTYDPKGDIYGDGPQFGCIQPSKNLRHRFLILDRGDPDVIQTHFHNVPFNAHFSGDSPDLARLEDFPGIDGFSLSTEPLYKVTAGNQWYLQVVYIITRDDSSLPEYRNRRSYRIRRDTSPELEDPPDKPRNGTNIIAIKLKIDSSHQSEGDSPTELPWVLPVVVVLLVIAVVVVVVCCLCFCFRRKHRRKNKEQSSEVTRRSNIEIAQQNSLRPSQRQNRLSQSKINVNIMEIKNTAVHQAEKDRTFNVKIKDTNIKSQGKNTQNISGTEV